MNTLPQVLVDLSDSGISFPHSVGLSKVPMLGGNITDLRLDNNLITQLANLPRTLRTLHCKRNKHFLHLTLELKTLGMLDVKRLILKYWI